MFGNMFGGGNEQMQGQVNELKERLKTTAGLSEEQANKTLDTIKDFLVEKYPMMQGMVENLLGGQK
jgi:hypothetical protein